MSNDRSPDEIMSLFDQAQEVLDMHDRRHSQDPRFDLRGLLWEVLDAVVWIGRDTASGPSPSGPGVTSGHEVMTSIDQFIGNAFGDD